MAKLLNLPGHTLPNYSEDAREDALFHYTTANGLLGILKSNEIWSTAYYCANDESELNEGRGVLTPLFRKKTFDMIRSSDPRVRIFGGRGVDIRKYAEQFESLIYNHALNLLCVYITCFCKANSKEDFLHGLLSQWRGYGVDGGYALQFSRKKLQEFADKSDKTGFGYELQDVYYSPDNNLKPEVLKHSDAFIGAYVEWLDDIADPKIFQKKTIQNPVSALLGGPIESLLDYIIHTKSEHFAEEKECRMSAMRPVKGGPELPLTEYFNRNGLIVPFIKCPKGILDCIEWIVIGPGRRIVNRFCSVTQIIRNIGLEIKVRPSHIPFSRD
jgi:hypothetical protein